ncbi:RNA methyltransferase, TrmH family [Salinimicrobium catena]|uniref:RNA methyltransferase, TrmH family n=1 Tax=Salinimicrobium catena TaxID=390640 RepID=A0A1H5NYE0_9FLAO|nr:RNA methyltransferase [Salinimicrobium catena]SDL65030.1 RNA methyltransferase, TrmH family [Salinimicrobium catena]SEF06616.1 RNA methyltransferase, TrmH family [Salinimicrobium catena]
MFSKSQIKLINSLAQKKYRRKHGLFTVEGKKGIFELLDSSLQLHSLFTTEDIFDAERAKTHFIEEAELKKISNLSTPQTALAVFHIPQPTAPEAEGLIVALDNVQDPGNLGTIIRMCDWFGVNELVCSEGTVDCYNPKVVQATMGSIARVNVNYLSLPDFLKKIQGKMPVYGAFLEGENLYSRELDARGIIVMGNEANGISSDVESYVTQKLLIPQLGALQKTESLNVATATAIFLSEFRRRDLTGK